jgi:hypothetical protein
MTRTLKLEGTELRRRGARARYPRGWGQLTVERAGNDLYAIVDGRRVAQRAARVRQRRGLGYQSFPKFCPWSTSRMAQPSSRMAVTTIEVAPVAEGCYSHGEYSRSPFLYLPLWALPDFTNGSRSLEWDCVPVYWVLTGFFAAE